MGSNGLNTEFLSALDELESTRGIPKNLLLEALEDALISAYKRTYGSSQNVRVEIDKNSGDIHVFFRKEVVEEVENDKVEMSLEEAREYDPEFEVGDMFESEVTPQSFGRIAALTAKQVVIQRLREAERNIIYDAYADDEGEIVRGTITRIEGPVVIIDMGKTEARLIAREQIPGEKYVVGAPIKVYVEEVRKGNRSTRLIISRANGGLLSRMMEQEISEIYDGVVEIKSVAREAGSKSKVAVYSNNPDVDAVGACIGEHGMRIQSISDELCGEKIEVIQWSDDIRTFVKNAISPAKVISVEAMEDERVMCVVVPDNQLSLAIGRQGQNVRLAGKLTACRIDIKSESQARAEEKARMEAEAAAEEAVADEVVADEVIADEAVVEAAAEEAVEVVAEAAEEVVEELSEENAGENAEENVAVDTEENTEVDTVENTVENAVENTDEDIEEDIAE